MENDGARETCNFCFTADCQNKYTFSLESASCAANFLASFEFRFAVVQLIILPFMLTSTLTWNSPSAFVGLGRPNSKPLHWQSSWSSLIGLMCMSQKLNIGFRSISISFQTWFRLKPESKSTAPTQDSTISPRTCMVTTKENKLWGQTKYLVLPYKFYSVAKVRAGQKSWIYTILQGFQLYAIDTPLFIL